MQTGDIVRRKYEAKYIQVISHRYITVTAWLGGLCGVLSCIAAAAVGAPLIVEAVCGLVAFGAIAVMGFYLMQMFASVRALQESLGRTLPARVPIRRHSLIKEVEAAFNEFVAEYSERFEGLDEQNSEIALKLQLLERQKKNTEAIIYSIRDSVIVVDAFDRIVLANDAAERLFGFKFNKDTPVAVEETIGDKGFVDLMVKSRRSRIRHVRHEVSLADDPGNRIFDCIISCVKDDKGIVAGLVAILHDMTREKEISRMKNDFVSHVSHELKTPLASINAYAEMLVDGEAQDEEAVAEFCGIIQSQAQRLNRLIEDILNISRIESGLTKVDKRPASLAILVKDATEALASYAREKNITVHTKDPIIYDQALADKDMMTQVIVNLLSNAIKYTPSGGRVDVNVEVDQAENVVRVTVSDTGVGIPPEDIEHVFDKFFRVEVNKQQAKGTGLGLNLVKQIIEKIHEGKVFVTSVQGEGSTFGFVLPLAAERVMETA